MLVCEQTPLSFGKINGTGWISFKHLNSAALIIPHLHRVENYCFLYDCNDADGSGDGDGDGDGVKDLSPLFPFLWLPLRCWLEPSCKTWMS